MIVYRSIGSKELYQLFSGSGKINGMYNCSKEKQNTSNIGNACCFFIDNVRWYDKNHRFFLVLDIPEEYLEFGIGEYYAGSSLAKTNVWSGRKGNTLYKIREAYSTHYNISNIKEIHVDGYFSKDYTLNKLLPVCEANNITLYSSYTDTKKSIIPEDKFKLINGVFQTVDTNDWLKNVSSVDSNYEADATEDIILYLKNNIVSTNQLKEIKQILNM